MKIKKIVLETYDQDLDESEEVASFDFRDPFGTPGFKIKSFTGLGAEDVQLRFSGFSNFGNRIYNRKLEKRNILLHLELQKAVARRPDEPSSENGDVRDQFYRMISSSRTGTVRLVLYPADLPNVYTESDLIVCVGRLVRVEPDLFSELTTLEVSIEAEDPMLYAGGWTVIPSSTYTDPEEITITDSRSTAPHGFTFSVEFTGPANSFTIGDPDENWEFKITPGVFTPAYEGFVLNDILTISSEFGKRKVTIEREGSTYSAVDRINPGGVWPIIYPGDNTFSIVSENFDLGSITYTPTFWGV